MRRDRPPCCYSNHRNVTRSIHLVRITAASSSPGTPLSVPASKRERACVSAHRLEQAHCKGDGVRVPQNISYYFYLIPFLPVFTELGGMFINDFPEKREYIQADASTPLLFYAIQQEQQQNPDKQVSNVMLCACESMSTSTLSPDAEFMMYLQAVQLI